MPSYFQNIPPVTKNLLILNALIWLVMVILPNGFDATFTEYCGLFYAGSSHFKLWQPLTYMFLHDTQSIAHLFFNMFALLMFGSTLEQVFGSRRFLIFYVLVGIGAALVQEWVYFLRVDYLESHYGLFMDGDSVMGPKTTSISVASEYGMLHFAPTIGASGAIYGVLLAFGMMFPNLPMYLFFIPVPIKAKWMVIGYGVLELVLGVTGTQSGVAHFAHLGGMLVALMLIMLWRKQGKISRGPLY
jgi:membrane associated rhomboid family serine protease